MNPDKSPTFIMLPTPIGQPATAYRAAGHSPPIATSAATVMMGYLPFPFIGDSPPPSLPPPPPTPMTDGGPAAGPILLARTAPAPRRTGLPHTCASSAAAAETSWPDFPPSPTSPAARAAALRTAGVVPGGFFPRGRRRRGTGGWGFL